MTYARLPPYNRFMASFLTPRQKEILDFIREFKAAKGYTPTHKEICTEFGYSSYGTVHKHLKLLEQITRILSWCAGSHPPNPSRTNSRSLVLR